MPNHDISVPSLPLKDFLSAFGLDHANIKDLDYYDKKIVDVLPSRRKRYLVDYFYNIPLTERKKVKYVS